MSAARFAKLIEQLQSFPIRDGVVLEVLQFMLTSKWGEERWKNLPCPFH
jgi:hypothetical protein